MKKTIDLPHIKGRIDIGDDLLSDTKIKEFFQRTDINQALKADDFDYIYEKWMNDGPWGTEVLTEIFLVADVDVLEYLTKIPFQAFAGFDNLTSMAIPNNITEIGVMAFSECGSLKSIDIPNSVTRIDELAFELCEELESVTIPGSVKKMGHGVFAHSLELDTIYCEAEEKPMGWNKDWLGMSNAEVIWGA